MPAASSSREPHGRRTPQRTARAGLTGVLAGVLAGMVTVGLAACSVGPPPRDEPALSTPLASYDTSEAVVKRKPFCHLVNADVLEEAIGEVVEPTSWGDGDRVAVGGGRDRVQEHGCAWETSRGGSGAGSGAGARAWVLVPPVTPGLARELVRDRPPRGCRPIPEAADFGTPSRALTCRDGTVRFAGLFGDAWLTCELTTPEPRPGLAGRWCVAVATVASLGR